jgi:hypothetical protein
VRFWQALFFDTWKFVSLTFFFVVANYSAKYDVGGLHTFNTHDGFLEAVVRGYRKGILTSTDYGVLTQCDSLDDLKVGLVVFLNNLLCCCKKKKKNCRFT